MSLLSKVKTGAAPLAEKVKAGAEQAATRAREEVEELQVKRALGQAYGELGEKALELVDRGEFGHPEVQEVAARARELKAQLAAMQTPANPS